MSTIDAESVMKARDNRVCMCGHKNVSHALYDQSERFVGIGNGPCGIDRDERNGGPVGVYQGQSGPNDGWIGDMCPCEKFRVDPPEVQEGQTWRTNGDGVEIRIVGRAVGHRLGEDYWKWQQVAGGPVRTDAGRNLIARACTLIAGPGAGDAL